MSQPDETHGCPYCGDEHPRWVACAIREPDRTCPGCEGDGLCHYDDALPGEPCDWCAGAGEYVRPALPEAERRAQLRRLEALLAEITANGGHAAPERLAGRTATPAVSGSGESLHLAAGRGTAPVGGLAN